MLSSFKELKEHYHYTGERKKEEKKETSFLSQEEEPCAREDDTKWCYLSDFLTTAPASSFVEGEKKKIYDGGILLTIGPTSIEEVEGEKKLLYDMISL